MRTIRLALATAALAWLGGPAMGQDAPARVVSVGGAVTEILYALGEGERVVGVDTTSLYPAEALATKPDVGYMRALSAEGVLSLAPDLVVMDEGAGPREAVAQIEAAGVAIRRVPTGQTVPDLLEKLRGVAGAVGRAGEGEAMAARIAAQASALERAIGTPEPRRRVLFILSMVDGRPNAAGRGTGADAMIRLAGGENVFAEAEGYKVLSAEAAAALAPDVIVTVDRAGGPPVDPSSVPGLAASPAARAGAVVRMDALYLLGFGPRTMDAARDLAARLYPGRLPDVAAAR